MCGGAESKHGQGGGLAGTGGGAASGSRVVQEGRAAQQSAGSEISVLLAESPESATSGALSTPL